VSGDRVARGDAAEDGGARPAGMGSGTWRKAYGALKDSTKVGLANFNSEYKVMTTMPCLRCPIDRSVPIYSPAAPGAAARPLVPCRSTVIFLPGSSPPQWPIGHCPL